MNKVTSTVHSNIAALMKACDITAKNDIANLFKFMNGLDSLLKEKEREAYSRGYNKGVVVGVNENKDRPKADSITRLLLVLSVIVSSLTLVYLIFQVTWTLIAKL